MVRPKAYSCPYLLAQTFRINTVDTHIIRDLVASDLALQAKVFIRVQSLLISCLTDRSGYLI